MGYRLCIIFLRSDGRDQKKIPGYDLACIDMSQENQWSQRRHDQTIHPPPASAATLADGYKLTRFCIRVRLIADASVITLRSGDGLGWDACDQMIKLRQEPVDWSHWLS
jgi:hypothetical protein